MNEETMNEHLVRGWLEDVLLSKSEGRMNAQYIRRQAPEYWAKDYVAHHDPLAKILLANSPAARSQYTE